MLQYNPRVWPASIITGTTNLDEIDTVLYCTANGVPALTSATRIPPIGLTDYKMKMGYLEFWYCKMNNSGKLKSSCGAVWNLWSADPEDKEGAMTDMKRFGGADARHTERQCIVTFMRLEELRRSNLQSCVSKEYESGIPKMYTEYYKNKSAFTWSNWGI